MTVKSFFIDFYRALKDCFKQYAQFNGRASRAEFWYFILFMWIMDIAVTLLFGFTVRGSVISCICSLLTWPPYSAVMTRRLHDVGLSGWWSSLPTGLVGGGLVCGAAFVFVPDRHLDPALHDVITDALFGGAIIGVLGGVLSMVGILVICLYKGDKGANEYGPPAAVDPDTWDTAKK